MAMRIGKYLPMFGIGADVHMALPPSMPPPPPSPPNPAPIPYNRWVVLITNTASAAVFGKWSLASVQTEGMGNILWQYDWGMGQFHQAIGPALITPSIPLCTLFSSIKYFLPSFSVKEKIDGGALANIGGGDAPVAICTPAYFVTTQDCQDIGGVGFAMPSSICFQIPSTRWVGFNGGDFAAGMIGMAGDALAGAILGKFGGKLIPGQWDDQMLALIGGGIGVLSGVVGSLPTWAVVVFGLPLLGTPIITWGAGKIGEAVGDAWGSKPWEAGPAYPGGPVVPPPAPEPPPGGAGGQGGAASDAGAGGQGGAPPVSGNQGMATPGPADAGAGDAPSSSTPADAPAQSSSPDDQGGVCLPDSGGDQPQ
jgi:hypothetical protein